LIEGICAFAVPLNINRTDSQAAIWAVGLKRQFTDEVTRGVLFTPVSVEEILRKEFPEIIEYEIVVKKKGIMDEITLKIEPQVEMGAEATAEITATLIERLKMKTNLRFNIQLAKPGELPRYTLKLKRFKDLRGT
jgi:phenylacetate-CoA ligase